MSPPRHSAVPAHALALVLATTALASLACTDEVLRDLPPPATRGDTFHRGVSLGLFASTKDPAEQRAIYTELLNEVQALGATDVELVIEWGQSDVTATELAPVAGADLQADDALLAWTIAAAHDRRLRVFLMPILKVDRRTPREWRGTLIPRDRDRWWSSYRAFILHYAKLAAENGVELLSVGSELVSMENDEARWRALIADTRAIYRGRLTYSANWDHFEPVEFFDALDVAGITAYQPLVDERTEGGATADDAALDRGWTSFATRLHAWAARSNLRYIFTEVGYASNAHAASRPWDYRADGEPELALQARCYRSLYRVWNADARLDGLYIWNWFGFGGPRDLSYTPRGKPAERVLRRWYQGSRG